MAIIGQTLTAPETGWRRLDDSDINVTAPGVIKYTGDPSCWNYAQTYYNIVGGVWKFNFTGTRLRLIATATSIRVSYINISIDGITEQFREYRASGTQYRTLVFEKLGLGDVEHNVVITTTSATDTTCLDAIDIDSAGYLRPYNIAPTQKICTKLEDMAVGDIIPCRYTATTSGVAGTFSELGTCAATEIPYAGSATPNGLFFLIKSDTGMLIADRVIQTNISWDVLNTAKFIQGSDVRQNAIPNMESDNYPSGIASASSSTWGFYPFYAFNTNYTSNDWGSTAPSGWLAYEFPTSKIICSYSITAASASANYQAPKSWTFEGFDGAVWIVLDNRSSVSTWSNSEKRTFEFNNKTPYIKYRINVTENFSGGSSMNLRLASLEMRESPLIIRSITGGNAYLGTDGSANLTDKSLGAYPTNNEWDTYVIKSNLNNKIIAGDNNIWHWNANSSTWCQDTTITGLVCANKSGAGSTRKIIRGKWYTYDLAISSVDTGASSALDPYVGFRPVLEYLETNSKATTLWY